MDRTSDDTCIGVLWVGTVSDAWHVAVIGEDPAVHIRIAHLMDEAGRDRATGRELFSYVWTMLCVRRGLMRVVREIPVSGTVQLVIEETRTGGRRMIRRPPGLDSDLELLAVQAMGKILEPPAVH